jgi:hypothetical protein
MSRSKADPEREDRIVMEIIVDAYTAEEQAMGWYYYLEDNLDFPFPAVWNSSEVKVVEMSPEEDCEREMFVEVLFREGDLEDLFSVRLSDLKIGEVDAKTAEALADWNYWLGMGYDFSDEDDEM